MFVITEADAAAIRAVYQQRGEFSAAVELRRRFPGITDSAQALGVRPQHRKLEAAAAADGGSTRLGRDRNIESWETDCIERPAKQMPKPPRLARTPT
jgi:hypothetical protein